MVGLLYYLYILYLKKRTQACLSTLFYVSFEGARPNRLSTMFYLSQQIRLSTEEEMRKQEKWKREGGEGWLIFACFVIFCAPVEKDFEWF